MTVRRQCILAATVLFATAAAVAQAPAPATAAPAAPAESLPPAASIAPGTLSPDHSGFVSGAGSATLQMPQPLFDFKDSDIKFNLRDLMDVLRDRKHEGWVLAAYPDPKTSRPLIGAGFSLDVAATDHPQRDPLNPHPFLEPSSAQLWQAAGLDSERLQKILDQFDRNLSAWGKARYRKKIRLHTLSPDVTEEEADRLLRISAIQSIENAKAYCRNFDQLTAPQQMALSQLVFQMGVNLEEFVQFLGTINGDTGSGSTGYSSQTQSNGLVESGNVKSGSVETDAEHWSAVQRTLIESEWARHYSGRAATVVAMFDPEYAHDPSGAERRVEAVLRPPAKHHHRRSPPSASLRAASETSHGRTPGRKAPGSQHKPKVT
jgi:hypothetical protein